MGVVIKCKGICTQHTGFMNLLSTYCVAQCGADMGGSLKKRGGSSVLEGAGHAALPGGECGVLNSIEKEGKASRRERKGGKGCMMLRTLEIFGSGP